jgi:hypothetical protein
MRIYSFMRDALVGLTWSAVLTFTPAQGQTPEVLHEFEGLDGIGPRCTLVQGADRIFYGITAIGGDPSLRCTQQ